MKFAILESSKASDISNRKILKSIDRAIAICKECGYDIETDDIIWQEKPIQDLAVWIPPKTTRSKSTIQLSTYLYDNTKDDILETILHELAHKLAFDKARKSGIIYRYEGDWMAVRGKYTPHGKHWRSVTDKMSEVTDISFSVTGKFDNQARLLKDAKYIVRCNNCGKLTPFQRQSEFVRNPNKKDPKTGKYLWTCNACDAQGKFELTKGEINEKYDRNTDMKFRLIESVQGTPITDKQILALIDAGIEICRDCGYDVDKSELVFLEKQNSSWLGRWSAPKDKYDKCTITLNPNIYHDGATKIMSTILHELGHHIDFLYMRFNDEVFFKDGRWQCYKSINWKPHGYRWERIVNKLSAKSGVKITVTDTIDNQEVKEATYKYWIRCKSCGNEFGYQRLTDFVRNPNAQNPVTGNYRWSCAKCHAKGQWERVR